MKNFPPDSLEYYASLLSDIGALSKLFSESDKPFIHSRTAEYLFCKIFDAENLSRSDVAIDAKKASVGTGVKTFVYSGRPTYQKIAEFNKAIVQHGGQYGAEKIQTVSNLRNERIRFVEATYGIKDLDYHCVLRDNNKIIVYEESMDKIDLEKIRIDSENASTIRFSDGKNKYSYSISKSTISKEFFPKSIILETDVKILEDPFDLLSKLSDDVKVAPKYQPKPRIVLPMYGYENGLPCVFSRSGLNQWNAGGRVRSYDEVYLPIPVAVREKFPNFLPDRETPFELRLPNNDVLTVKVSQAEGKALMSNPNSALGEWLLRDVLGLGEGELLTYEHLLGLGIDSVEIFKVDGEYKANFLPLGSYENFIKD
ncbi:hypothetical protein BH23PAT2_BH23PAT2_00870 [soil metagenome]